MNPTTTTPAKPAPPAWLANLVTDIQAGFELAAPIIGTFEPQWEPVFLEVAQIFAAVTQGGASVGSTVSPLAQSAITQSIAQSHAIAQKAGVKAG